MTSSDGIATAALVISILSGVLSIASIAYKATWTSYEKMRMQYLKCGRASHIIRKFNTADSDERFKQIVRMCVMNVDTFSVKDIKRLWSCLYPYWDRGIAQDDVLWLLNRLLYFNCCGTLSMISTFLHRVLIENDIEYTVVFCAIRFKRIVHTFRHAFLQFAAIVNSKFDMRLGADIFKQTKAFLEKLVEIERRYYGTCCVFPSSELYFATKMLLAHPVLDLFYIVRAMAILPEKKKPQTFSDPFTQWDCYSPAKGDSGDLKSETRLNVFDALMAIKTKIMRPDIEQNGFTTVEDETWGLLYIRLGNADPSPPPQHNACDLSLNAAIHQSLIQLDDLYSITLRESSHDNGGWQKFSRLWSP